MAATVTVKNADLLIDKTGTNSYFLKLRGNDGAADKDINVRTTGGGGAYRLSVYDNPATTELFYVNNTGDASHTRNLTVLGNTTLGDAAADTVTARGAVTTAKVNRTIVVDGVTYTTIQAALDALPASGGEVFIPEGDYPIATSLTLPAGCGGNVTIRGAGKGTKIHSTANVAIFSFTTKSGVHVRDLYLKNDVAPASASYGVYFLGGIGNSVSHCWLEDLYNGVWIEGVAGNLATDYVVEANQLDDCEYALFLRDTARYVSRVALANNVIYGRATGFTGIVVQLCDKIAITGNVVDDVGGNGIDSQANRTTITGNTVYNAAGDGIVNDNGSRVTISGNQVDDSGSEGIQNSGGGAYPVNITGNQVSISSGYGIFNDSGWTLNISGNNVYDPGTIGIYNSGSWGVQISDNTIYSSGNEGIYNVGSYVTISTNTMYSIGGTGIYDAGNYTKIDGNGIHWPASYGIHHASGDMVTISSNTLMGPGNYGIFVDGGSDTVYSPVVTGNMVYNPAGSVGIYPYYTQACTVSGNNIYAPTTYGIYCYESDYLSITGNNVMFGGSSVCIYLAGYNQFCTVTGNNTYSGPYGIYLSSTANDAHTITGNQCRLHSSYGLFLNDAFCSVVGNRFDASGYGIYATGNADWCTIVGNEIQYNTNWGLYLAAGSDQHAVGDNSGSISNNGAGNALSNNK